MSFVVIVLVQKVYIFILFQSKKKKYKKKNVAAVKQFNTSLFLYSHQNKMLFCSTRIIGGWLDSKSNKHVPNVVYEVIFLIGGLWLRFSLLPIAISDLLTESSVGQISLVYCFSFSYKIGNTCCCKRRKNIVFDLVAKQ